MLRNTIRRRGHHTQRRPREQGIFPQLRERQRELCHRKRQVNDFRKQQAGRQQQGDRPQDERQQQREQRQRQ
jgi:hypothetical protein